MYMGVDGPLYAFALFTPTIINQLGEHLSPCHPLLKATPPPAGLLTSHQPISPSAGYSATPANLLSVPIYVWACILTIGVGFLADKQGHRIIYNFIFLALGAAGYIILIASRKAALSYFAIYLAAAGIYPLIRKLGSFFFFLRCPRSAEHASFRIIKPTRSVSSRTTPRDRTNGVSPSLW